MAAINRVPVPKARAICASGDRVTSFALALPIVRGRLARQKCLLFEDHSFQLKKKGYVIVNKFAFVIIVLDIYSAHSRVLHIFLNRE